MIKMDLTTRYCVVMGCYWSNFAVFSNYATVYLLGRGFSNTAIGMMTAAASLFAALLQPALGAWADRPRSPSVKNILLLHDADFGVASKLGSGSDFYFSLPIVDVEEEAD